MYKQFTKNDIKTVLKPMKQCPSSLKINNTEIPFLTYLTGKEYDNIFCCQGCGENGNSYIAGGHAHQHNLSGEKLSRI